MTHTFNARATFVRAASSAVQRPDYRPAYEYNPVAALRAQAMARRNRRRAFWLNLHHELAFALRAACNNAKAGRRPSWKR